MSRNYYDNRFEKLKNTRSSEGLLAGPGIEEAACVRTMLGGSQDGRRNKDRSLSKVFVRYDEGAALYSMSVHTFMRLAADAKAVYKVNRISLVNTKIFEEYLETFREC